MNYKRFHVLTIFLIFTMVSCGPSLEEQTVAASALTSTVPPILTNTVQPISTPIPTPTTPPTITPEPWPDLPEEMQRVVDENGLKLVTDEETGKYKFVNENGGIRFYLNEAGVWVDFYEEIVANALNQEFWSKDGNRIDQGTVREFVRPVFTGGVIEKTFTLSGEQVSLFSLEAVVADENDPKVIREVLVFLQVTRSSDGKMFEGAWIMDEKKNRLFTVEEILALLSPGDQIDVDIFREIPDKRPGYCAPFTGCGIVWDINQEQDLNTLFGRVNSGEVVENWPEVILPTFIVYIPNGLFESWDLEN